jgi:hypothetical protein
MHVLQACNMNRKGSLSTTDAALSRQLIPIDNSPYRGTCQQVRILGSGKLKRDGTITAACSSSIGAVTK